MNSIEQGLTEHSILIVEDESVIALSIEEALEELGFSNVNVALNVADALELFENNKFDLAILDINLKDHIDGIELALLLKEQRELPVIFLTGNSDRSTVSKAKHAEPAGFLIKPFDKLNLSINLDIALFQQSPSSRSGMKNNQLTLDDHFFHNIPHFIIRLDRHKNILKLNARISRLTGKQPSFYENKTIHTAEFEDTLVTQIEHIADRVISNNRKAFVEISIPTIMGERMMSVVALPEMIDGETIHSVTLIFHDITDEKIAAADLESRNKKIVDSINYSKRIQKILLGDEERLRQYLDDSFILLIPKDIVSGDFPWVYYKNNHLYLAVVDCTGHGVPGALLSVVFHFLLNQILKDGDDLLPSRVLDLLHIHVNKTLKQHMPGVESKDGADIGLCRINLNTGTLDYSGAHRPLVLLRNNEISEFKGDKRPIGGAQRKRMKTKRFTNTSIQLQKDDFVCMFSDGITDQFGGNEASEKKIGSRRIKDMILSNSQKPCNEISKSVSEYFHSWKGVTKQVDDVLMIGLNWPD